MISLAEARKRAARATSYTRMDTVFWSPVIRSDWFRLLGSEWDCCDNLWFFRADLRQKLKGATREELDLMMDAAELAALAALPERFTVYRGCYEINRPGLSWTLDRDIAERFVTLTRYRRRDEQQILRIGTVSRDRAVLKLGRNEQEIIAHDVRIVREELLPVVESA